MVVQPDFPPVKGSRVQDGDNVGVDIFAIIVHREIEGSAGIHPSLGHIEMSFPGLKEESSFRELGDKADPLSIGVVFGAAQEGDDGEQDQGDFFHLFSFVI
jgi:hypothetical protein